MMIHTDHVSTIAGYTKCSVLSLPGIGFIRFAASGHRSRAVRAGARVVKELRLSLFDGDA
jgi:hypothetical protein